MVWCQYERALDLKTSLSEVISTNTTDSIEHPLHITVIPKQAKSCLSKIVFRYYTLRLLGSVTESRSFIKLSIYKSVIDFIKVST